MAVRFRQAEHHAMIQWVPERNRMRQRQPVEREGDVDPLGTGHQAPVREPNLRAHRVRPWPQGEHQRVRVQHFTVW